MQNVFSLCVVEITDWGFAVVHLRSQEAKQSADRLDKYSLDIAMKTERNYISSFGGCLKPLQEKGVFV